MNKIFTRIVNILGFCFLTTGLLAQEENTAYIPPSPDAASLAKYANIPVSLYTGTVQVQAPLFELPSSSINIPVSLSYYASGIKVQDIASSYGLGWSLNAGGVVTRIVRGLPDESNSGFYGPNEIGKHLNQNSRDHLEYIANGEWDSEPDIFYFNFMGKSGRFVLDENGDAALIPYQDIKIIPAVGPKGTGKWIIIDENGISYTFGNSENDRETTVSRLDYQEQAKASTFVSSWFLSDIKGTDQQTIATFNYKSGQDLSYKYFRKHEINLLRTTTNSNPVDNQNYNSGVTNTENILIVVKSPKYLEQIAALQNKIRFDYQNSTRQDLTNGYILSTISLEAKGQSIKKYRFEFDYFTSDGCSTDLCKRLCLKKIYAVSNNSEQLAFQYTYNTTNNLPGRDSPKVDHWGYYNDNAHSSDIPELDFQGKHFSGANRETQAELILANTLTKITTIGGGFTEFKYSVHEYNDAGVKKLAGGLRIQQVIQSPGLNMGKSIITDYVYTINDDTQTSSGKLFSKPVYTSEYSTVVVIGAGGVRKDFLKRSSQSLIELFDINSSAIGYSSVTVKQQNNGKTAYIFTSIDEHSDKLAYQFKSTIYKEDITVTPISSLELPHAPNTYKGWERGLIMEEKTYNNENILQKRKRYTYKFNLPVIKSISGLRAAYHTYYSVEFKDYASFLVGRYDIISQGIYLEKVEEELYDQQVSANNTPHKLKDIISYEYNPYFQLTKETRGKPGIDKQYITEYKYVTDYSFGTGLGFETPEVKALISMQSKHIHAPVIEQIKYIKEIDESVPRVISSQLNVYHSGLLGSSGIPLLSEVKEFQSTTGVTDFQRSSILRTNGFPGNINFATDNRYRTVQTFTSYNPARKVTQLRGKNQLSVCYIWSEDNRYPIAEVKNGMLEQVAYSSFEENSNSASSNWIYFGDHIADGTAKTGRYVYSMAEIPGNPYLGTPTLTGNVFKPNMALGSYRLSYWCKQGEVAVSVMGGTVEDAFAASAADVDGWVYHQKQVAFTSTENSLTLAGSATTKLDELRLCPSQAQMTTYAYDPLVGVTSSTDANSITSYFEYDAFGRLQYVKDQDKHILKSYVYHYQK